MACPRSRDDLLGAWKQHQASISPQPMNVKLSLQVEGTRTSCSRKCKSEHPEDLQRANFHVSQRKIRRYFLINHLDRKIYALILKIILLIKRLKKIPAIPYQLIDCPKNIPHKNQSIKIYPQLGN
jgi:hypothetical protein